ncbi:bifunctional 3-(3-hydroxy-phenyl)propionate/3-hydroxycinnamic acid hydroxylase [Nocardia sp. NBC_01730]|uniref:bifunctional 3-(3-hydroxy-phenyl)propionate/3-hydroxycinnamic acid hydroxylase n=1 Tax=Nocardia sp. NBC_01730 TaxID=2975998 RepID=UPI002E0FAC62|nr:bifunctional 3-(3-hydroxy-phenyl)propionate/3-hydroxycinnamic acid hydroxylase [Nocardia sp. NBC_01730]
MTTKADYDVAVIGYGPVGMVTAALLGRSGRRVVVLERYATLYNRPRAAIFDDETMRTFDRLGIAHTLEPKMHRQSRYEWRSGSGELLIEHSFAAIGRQGWAEWYMMYQPDLEDALDACVRSMPNVTVQMNAQVTGIDQSSDQVLLSLDGATPVTASYVVACDGGNSFTREFLGIGQEDYGFSEPWMVCDFRLTSDVALPKARQVCDPVQPISVIALGHEHHRFSFMLDSEESFATETDPTSVWQRVAAYLAPDQAELIRAATYTFRSLVTGRWRVDRVLLAGDAAHQMPPFLGQGMCSGIRDAQNIAFKLDAILSGADTALLDSYQSEREPHVRAVIEKGIELGRIQTVRDPRLAAERDARLLAQRAAKQDPEKIRFPGLGPGLRTGTPQAGYLMPQATVTAGERTGRFDEIVGTGFVLLVDGRRGDPSSLKPAEQTGLRVVTLGFDIHDTDGRYGAWFDEHDCTAVLWRPDFYIYGTAPTAADISPLVQTLESALSPAESLVPTGGM